MVKKAVPDMFIPCALSQSDEHVHFFILTVPLKADSEFHLAQNPMKFSSDAGGNKKNI